MSFEPPAGILDIGNATLRVGKLEVAETSGLNQGLQNIIKNDLLITENNESSPYTTNQKWGLKLPTTWVGEFEVKGHSGKYIDFNFYNENSASNAQGYNLTFKDTTMTLRYDGGNPLGGGAATIPTIVGAFRKVNIFFERGVISVSIDGTRYLYFKESDGFNQGLGVASRVVSATGGAFVNVFIEQDADDSAFKNLRIVNGRFISDQTSNIAFIGGNLGVGVNSPKEALDIRGNMHLTRVSNVSQIKVSSNVVAEYTGPHDRPLRKYPEVALTADAETASGYKGYKVTISSVGGGDGTGYHAFNGNYADDSTVWGSGDFYNSSGGDATVSGAASTSVSGVSGAVIGEWIGLQLPNKIRLQDVKIAPQSYSGTQYGPPRTPTKGVVAGSIDGTNWELVHSFTTSGISQIPLDYLSSIGPINSTKYYNYFRIIAEEVVGGTNGTRFNLEELCFYGHEEGSASLDTTLKSVYNVPATTGTQLEVYYDGQDYSADTDFDQANEVLDKSGNNLHGSQTGGIGFDSTYKAFTFGTGDYIQTQTLPSTFIDDAQHSIAMWFNLANLADHRHLFWIDDNTTGVNNQSPHAVIESDGLLRYDFFANNIKLLDQIVPNQWYHLVITFSGGKHSSGTKFYINGAHNTNVVTGGTNEGGTLDIQASSYIVIGANNVGTTSTTFNGSIANFRLFSKVLNAGQIQELYDYQKDYFLGSKSQVTLYKGHLGVGVTEPSGQLELAGDERIQEYPPRAMTGWETYMEGHGVFRAGKSGHDDYLGSWDRWKVFNKGFTTSGGTAGDSYHGEQSYSSSTGLYTGVGTQIESLGGISGDYFILDMPYKISLKHINVTSSNQDRSPTEFIILGSNDGSTWTQIKSFSSSFTGAGQTLPFQVNSNEYFSYFGLVVTKVVASGGYLMLSEWQLFGTPGPTTLDKGSLTLGRSLDVPRVSRYDVDTETPRPEKLVVDYDTTVNDSPTDISGTATHGSFYGAGSGASDPRAYYSAADKAFKFDGTAGKNIRAATSSFPLNTDIDLSFSVWVKVDVATSTSWRGVWELGNRGPSENVGLYIPSSSSSASQGANRFNFSFWGNDCASGEDIVSNRWYHVAGAYTASTKTRHLYVDGILNNTFTSSAGMFSSLNPANPTLVIGSNSTSGYGEGLGGYVSNFKLYKASLEPSEVKKLYNLGRTGRSMVISDTAVGIGKAPEAQLDVRGNIYTSGCVRQRGLPLLKVSSTAGGSVTNAELNGTNWYNRVFVNQGGCFNLATGRFHVPVAGYYRMFFRASATSMNVRFWINGASPGSTTGGTTEAYFNAVQNNALQSGSSEQLIYANVGDYLSLQVSGINATSGVQHNVLTIYFVG